MFFKHFFLNIKNDQISLLITVIITVVQAGNYGNGGRSFAAASPNYNQATFQAMATPNHQYQMIQPIQLSAPTPQPIGPVSLAVRSQQNVQYYDIPSVQTQAQPYQVMVESQSVPMTMMFRTYSSPMNVKHQHVQSQGSVQESHSEDQPHILRHTVHKPIVQEIHEVITPMRTIRQEVRPVEENIQTLVARGQPSYGGGYGSPSPQPQMIPQNGGGIPLAPATGGFIGANGFNAAPIGFASFVPSPVPLNGGGGGGFIGSTNFGSFGGGGTGGKYGALPSFAGFAAPPPMPMPFSGKYGGGVGPQMAFFAPISLAAPGGGGY